MNKFHYLDCICSSPEHIIRITIDDGKSSLGDEEPEMYLEVQLAERSLWKRIKLAINFIIGRTNPFGYWINTSFTKERAHELAILCHQYRAMCENYEKLNV